MMTVFNPFLHSTKALGSFHSNIWALVPVALSSESVDSPEYRWRLLPKGKNSVFHLTAILLESPLWPWKPSSQSLGITGLWVQELGD